MPVRNSTYQVLPQNSVTLYMVSLAPGNQFQGELSLVQLFFERLNDTQIASMAFNCANTTYDFGNSPLLISWDKNFTTLDRSNPGVIQVQPGICDISNCLPGRLVTVTLTSFHFQTLWYSRQDPSSCDLLSRTNPISFGPKVYDCQLDSANFQGNSLNHSFKYFC